MQTETIQKLRESKFFFRCPCILIYNNNPVPLKKVRYNVAINGGLANVTLSQEYVNNESTVINVTYKFPISDKVVFSGIKAIFKGRKVVGEIKEKKKAKMEFEHRKARGDVVAYAEQLEDTEDIMKLELGNFPSGESLTISFSYLVRLDVVNEVNWGFRIPSTLTPRYNPGTGENHKSNTPSSIHNMTVDQKYPWEINVIINWPGEASEIKCTTHSDNTVIQRVGNVMKISFGTKAEYPNKDFEIIFQDKQLFSNQCSVAVCDLQTIKGKSPKYAAIMQFVPSMYKWYHEKGVKEEKGVDFYEDENTFFLLENTLAEFIFILDRSGSMSGTRIEKAKKALEFFIKSLPPDSRFNIINFGSSFKPMFPNSVVYSSETVKTAISQLSMISADMGGTNILGPVNSAFCFPLVPHFQRNIFLLTDGSVSNTQQVLQSIESHCINNSARVFSIGIGNGISEMLVHRSAKLGGGRSVVISDSENVESKIIGLLNDALTPSLTHFKIEFDKKYIAALAPMLDSESHITRGEPFVMYALLKNDIENAEDMTTQVKVSFFDSVTKKMEERLFKLSLEGCITDSAYHKMCVKHLIDAKKTIKNNVYIESALASKSNIYEKLAIGYQVLSAEHTAFICVIEENQDGHYVQSKEVIVPNIESIDYSRQHTPQNQLQHIQSPPLLCSAPQQIYFDSCFSNSIAPQQQPQQFNFSMPPPPPPTQQCNSNKMSSQPQLQQQFNSNSMPSQQQQQQFCLNSIPTPPQLPQLDSLAPYEVPSLIECIREKENETKQSTVSASKNMVKGVVNKVPTNSKSKKCKKKKQSAKICKDIKKEKQSKDKAIQPSKLMGQQRSKKKQPSLEHKIKIEESSKEEIMENKHSLTNDEEEFCNFENEEEDDDEEQKMDNIPLNQELEDEDQLCNFDQNIEIKEYEDVKKDVTIINSSSVSSIALAQEFDGSWKYSLGLISQVGLIEEKVNTLRAKITDDYVLMTLLIVTWMMKYAKSKQFDIIIKKGKMFLMKNKVEDDLKKECKLLFN